jgi:glycosyltransferase involved in cell wall biosynthesis
MEEFPKISVITPSFNQEKFLEKTILSVLDQNYPNLEYIIVDGGSTDGSLEIIKKYEKQLAWWVSEKDEGQVTAINKGLRRATGTWIGWQNSDDIYFKNTFNDLRLEIKKNPEVDIIIADMFLIDDLDNKIRDIRYVKPSYKSVLVEGMVLSNQSAFWKRNIHNELGYLSEQYQYSFDYEWFLKILKHGKAVHVNKIWGGFRIHQDTKTFINKNKFNIENNIITNIYKPFFLEKKYFQFRRIILMLIGGQWRYVLRGIVNRLTKFIKTN